ncbi:MAG: flagellar assembly protein FliW [Lachnospiraceae bacterium]|jgi:flagellar assembly factor FliW|nr:flagellar assembly protein FliW [Lachnospiraceae bacterium]MBO7362549.1 flagellar assembly protein FliW [Lachnospiraceae bacterium]MBO7530831.1 flagellar assembly protein FliW [Lachnospiraceae bacterium]MBP5253741.1 flagellar assembly protein FliW [Lachnospiraceae bacterium]MBP5471935.1 flagellar assembly protein FliW [Lachnospiraceae bacterium]
MLIKTKIFGEVEISDEKILTFEDGIIGFPDLKHFTLIHDEEKGNDAGIRYFQSIEEPGFAMPVMNPLMVCETYNPQVSEELLSDLGNLSDENIVVLVTVTVPTDLTKMTVNLQGPIIINSDEKKGAQIIVEGNDYPVRFPIYDILKARKEGN